MKPSVILASLLLFLLLLSIAFYAVKTLNEFCGDCGQEKRMVAWGVAIILLILFFLALFAVILFGTLPD